MQYTVNQTQAEGIVGEIGINVANNPITRYAEDNNCESGKFAFEGTNPQTQAVGIKADATAEQILGVVKRTPFQSSKNYKNSNKIIPGTVCTIINKGTAEVKIDGEISDTATRVGVNSSTGRIELMDDEKSSNDNIDNFAETEIKFEYSTIDVNLVFNDVVYGGDYFFAVSENEKALVGDGVDYKTVKLPSGKWKAASYNNSTKRYVTVSEDGKVAYSTDSNASNFVLGTIPDYEWYGIACNNDNRFVAVSYDGKAAYSEDGISFIECTIPYGMYTSITYGDGKFVAVSYDGKAAYSTDGETFIDGAIPKTENYQAIAYGYYGFVVVGAGGVTVSSKDGITFTSSGYNSDYYWTGIAYSNNNNLYVAVNKSGIIAYFTPGIKFIDKDASANLSGVEKSIAYGNGVYVAVSSVERAKYSTDGINWKSCNQPSDNGWYDIVYGKDGAGRGKFVAVYSDKVAFSNDGITFLDGTIPDGDYHSIVYGVDKVGKSKFVAVSYDGKAAYSEDGLSFTKSSIPDNYYVAIAYGDGMFVAVSPNRIAYSADGRSFIEEEVPEGNYTAIAYGNNRFVAVSPNQKAIYSTDGENFTESTLPDGYWNNLCYGNGRFVSVSYYYDDEVIESTDGINWTKGEISKNNNWCALSHDNGQFLAMNEVGKLAYSPDIIFEEVSKNLRYTGIIDFNDMVFGNNRYVVVGMNGIAYSEDCLNWTKCDISVENLSAVTYGDKFVAVGESGSFYSEDGINWTIGTIDSEKWRDIIYHADKFVAVGDNNKIAYSTDGKTFTLADAVSGSSTNTNLKCITYGNKFVAIGNGVDVFTSTDGVNWIINNDKISFAEWEAMVYGEDGKFVAVSYDGKAAYSEDGITFTDCAISQTGVWSDITYGDGMYAAVSRGSRITIYSTDGINWNYCPISDGIWESLIYQNNKFIALNSTGVIAFSNGTIIFYNSNEEAGTVALSGIAFGKGRFVITDYSLGDIFYSTDAKNFYEAEGELSDENLSAVTYSDKFVALSTDGKILSSTDGVNWAKLGNIDGIETKSSWGNITFSDYDNRYVAISHDGKTAYSEDSISWTEGSTLSYGNWSRLIYGRSVYGNSVFVAVNLDQTKQGEAAIAHSTDGITFTEGTLPEDVYLFDITYGDKFVAVGESGSFYSEDGVNWFNGTKLDGIYTTIAYGDGVYLTIDIAHGSVAYSTDGINFIVQEKAITPDEYVYMSYGNGLFIAIEQDGKVAFAKVSGSASDLLDTGWKVLKNNKDTNLITIYK